jgi:hypothetical protein
MLYPLDHDGTSREATAERACCDLHCRGASRAVIAIPSHQALAGRAEIRN